MVTHSLYYWAMVVLVSSPEERVASINQVFARWGVVCKGRDHYRDVISVEKNEGVKII